MAAGTQEFLSPFVLHPGSRIFQKGADGILTSGVDWARLAQTQLFLRDLTLNRTGISFRVDLAIVLPRKVRKIPVKGDS